MNKNDVFEIEITDFSTEGLGIGKAEGFVWFIKDTVIGDYVRASVTKVKKNYGFARLVEVLKPSKARVLSSCIIAKQCGGCQIQAMAYSDQLKFKAEKVIGNIVRLGGMDETEVRQKFEGIAGMDYPVRYRNKAQFPFGYDKDGELVTGFFAGRTHRIIPVQDCLIGAEENHIILDVIKNWMKEFHIKAYNEMTHTGLVRHALIRKGAATGELMVCLVINGTELPHARELVDRLKAIEFEDSVRESEEAALRKEDYRLRIASISYSVNTEKTNVIMGTDVKHLFGPGYIEDYIGEIRFRISPLSFFQVNPVQTEKLYATALEYADLEGNETVWDIYCGIGTISLFLAQKAQKVYGVEIVPQAIENAKENAKLNGMNHTEFFVGKAEEVLPEWYASEQCEKIDAVVVDPPRKGCDERCLETIVKLSPRRIVYVSCDSATLGRDLKYMQANGYRVDRIKAVDMFPHTVHVETVCLLSKLNAKQHIEVELNMDELDLTSAESKATYDEIKAYVLEKHGLKVSSLYISQVKRKCGLDVGQNYNLSKKEDAKVPQCPPEKEKAIQDALEYFKMI